LAGLVPLAHLHPVVAGAAGDAVLAATAHVDAVISGEGSDLVRTPARLDLVGPGSAVDQVGLVTPHDLKPADRRTAIEVASHTDGQGLARDVVVVLARHQRVN